MANPTRPKPPFGKGPRRPFSRRKFCRFCADPKLAIDYKNYQLLKDYISERGKIVPRRVTGTCALHQREVTVAIKRARNIAILPFAIREG